MSEQPASTAAEAVEEEAVEKEAGASSAPSRPVTGSCDSSWSPSPCDDALQPTSNSQIIRPQQLLDPPMSRGEKFRDAILRTLDHRIFQLLGIVALILIILDGALFFFLLVGWHTLCDTPSKTNCTPRNQWYNFSVQFLNGLFTYTALTTVAWRCTNLLHILGWSCPYRSNHVGHDLYGHVTKEMWFHTPLRRRAGITWLLVGNCFFQFANQLTRVRYHGYDLQATYPGTLWTNVFFGLSMVCAAVAAFWYAMEEHWLITQHPPGTFPPGLVQVIQAFVKQHHNKLFCGCSYKKKKDFDDDDDEVTSNDKLPQSTDEIEDGAPPMTEEANNNLKEQWEDPTENPGHHRLIPCSRPGMRMFGM